jgi:hypothetical protein
MLGDKIGEENGKVTSRRVLKSGDPRYLKLEISYEAQATLYGVGGMEMGTYEIFERVPGQLYGEGQGVFMGGSGEGAIWNGHGVGHFSEDGSMSFAASVTFQAGANGDLSRLNGVLMLVEHRSTADGAIHSEFSEWKA